MEELAQLFAQVDEYVVQQEEQVEQIDQQGEQVVVDVNKANTELDTGIKQARSRNRKKWWCLLICSKSLIKDATPIVDNADDNPAVLIIVIVVGVVAGVVVSKKGNSPP